MKSKMTNKGIEEIFKYLKVCRKNKEISNLYVIKLLDKQKGKAI